MRENYFYYVLVVTLLIITCVNYSLKFEKQRYANALITCVEKILIKDARERFCTKAHSMLQKNYDKYTEHSFYIFSSLEKHLIISDNYVEEFKTALVNES